jgi:hypothetical protein
MAGARWIIALDADLERRLLARESEALAAWMHIQTHIRYWDNPEWREYRRYSQLLPVQDVRSGGLLSGGILDLLSVLHTSARPAPTRRLGASSLRGARVVLNLDAESISAQQNDDLQTFVRAGGTVVNPPAGWRFPEISEQFAGSSAELRGLCG